MIAALLPTLADTAATLSAVVLAAVFSAAAAVKFTSITATAAEFASLGLGRSRLLPLVVATAEAATAAALVVRPALGAALAAALLVAFTAVVTWALAADRNVSCGCFGPLSREPVSSATIARNAVLLILAVIAGGNAGAGTPDLASTITVTVAALTLVVVAQAGLTARHLGRLWSVDLAGEPTRQSSDNDSAGAPSPPRDLVTTPNRIERIGQ